MFIAKHCRCRCRISEDAMGFKLSKMKSFQIFSKTTSHMDERKITCDQKVDSNLADQ